MDSVSDEDMEYEMELESSNSEAANSIVKRYHCATKYYEKNEDNENCDDDVHKIKKNVQTWKPTTFIDAYVDREKVIDRVTTEFISIWDDVLSNPMKNLKKLAKILEIIDLPKSDPQYGAAFFSIQKMAFRTLSIILNDIIPNYRISKKSTTEARSLKIKTEEISNYEHKLLQCYKLYVQRLERVIYSAMGLEKKSDFYYVMLTTQTARSRLAMVACRCLTELVLNHLNFNFRDNVIALVARILCNNTVSDNMRQLCHDCIKKLFDKDLRGEATVVAITNLCQFIVNHNYCVSTLALEVFLHLPFRKTVTNNDNSDISVWFSGLDFTKMSKKERKRAKMMHHLERELLEAEATENQQIRHKCELEFHRHLYAFYMRYLNYLQEMLALSNIDIDRHRSIFPMILNGIVMLAANSNEDFSLHLATKLMAITKLTLKIDNHSVLTTSDRLIFLKSSFEILTYTRDSYDIDFSNHYRNLYELCSHTDLWNMSFYPLIQCIDLMIVRRIKDISKNRLNNFLLRFILMSFYLSSSSAITVLCLVRRVLYHNTQVVTFLDEDYSEERYSLDRYPTQSNDPDQSFARECDLVYCLKILTRNHYSIYVRYLAMAILKRSNNSSSNDLEDIAFTKMSRNECNLNMEFWHKIIKTTDSIEVYEICLANSYLLQDVKHHSMQKKPI